MSKRVVVPEPLPDGCCHPSCPFYSEGEWSGPKCWALIALAMSKREEGK